MAIIGENYMPDRFHCIRIAKLSLDCRPVDLEISSFEIDTNRREAGLGKGTISKSKKKIGFSRGRVPNNDNPEHGGGHWNRRPNFPCLVGQSKKCDWL
jgi:hypothetical protein